VFTVYVLVNKKNIIYIGQTNNIERRLDEHNNNLRGKVRRYTKDKGPWTLKYKEEFKTRKEAIKKENTLKSHKGRDYLKSILGP